ncbi:hypothetical protein PF005_g15576 [Phytophthora fragariae]|uniref:Uncharacterized protein n=1 Tax=Phytophthora fragariae TaxID=53985 RepID=A0A6A3XIJ8_9STRA|nr:hypothetical protein PF005_g15576 [Phytophthora fragariae]
MIKVPHSALQLGTLAEVVCAKGRFTACLEKDPFETEGVGELVRLTVEHGCAMRPMIELCIFGDHAATPNADTG